MAIHFTHKPTKPIEALGIGVFDGFHVGHQSVAQKATHLLTFSPHPAKVVGKPVAKRLTTISEMHALYPHFIVLQFTKEVAHLPWNLFLEELVSQLSPKKIVVGYDFQFGHKKQGTLDKLKEWASSRKITIETINPTQLDGHIIKSSLVRDRLTDGNFTDALHFLGHPYIVRGKVIHGEGRGKKLGFPTANLQVPTEKLIPSPGVYQGTVQIDHIDYSCLIYIGSKPTFAGKKTGIEVFVKEFSGDLYGKILSVSMTRKIRGDMKFPSSEELVNQINKDLLS